MVLIDTPMNGWSHLVAESEEELHQFALQLGIRRIWFQDKPGKPHYDVRAEQYRLALTLGAVPVQRREIIFFLEKYYRSNNNEFTV